MDAKKENEKNNKVEEPAVEYQAIKPKFKGIDHETFDFDAEFARGLTQEKAKTESLKRIRKWWEQREHKGIDHETFYFDTEFARGLTSEEFKAEMRKRIQAYPWKNKH